jgi:Ca2+-binding RTX toxin-like protein
MVTINLQQSTPTISYVGGLATHDLFGANFLFSRDGAWQPGEVSRPYQAFAQETGLSNLRYPGGTMTEEHFDMANPNNTGDTSDGKKGLVAMSTFFEYTAEIGATATIVVPTYRLFTDQFDDMGQRVIGQEVEPLVRQFIQFTLQEAGKAGTKVAGFELGNEWWVDNTAIFGFRMTPIEYGRMANFLTRIIQEEIDSHNQDQASWNKIDPDIVIQVGPGGNSEWYSREELGLAGPGPELSATEVIFRQITDPTSKAAIDGLVTHRYLMGTDAAVSGWPYKPFSYWESLAQATPGFKTDLRKYVTEWNVSARNDTEIGLKQFDSMVLLIREMMVAGVDLANVWAVQQNNSTKLTYNTGTKDVPFGGLTFGGTAFDMMAAQLPGLRVIQSSGTLANLQCVVFGSNSSVVYFLTNKTGVHRNDTITKTTVPAGTTHVSIYEVTEGADGRPTVAVRTFLLSDLPNNISLQLSIDETAMMVFTKGQNGAHIEGYDLADSLVGTFGDDVIMGGHLDDTVSGHGGDDTIWGEAGNDLLFGGDGNDSLVGGIGNDLIYGGSGDDSVEAGSGEDTIFGGSGEDTLFLSGVQQNITLDLGSEAPIYLSSLGLTFGEFEHLISGIGHDSIRGSDSSNLMRGMEGDDTISGLAGDDTLNGGEGNDVVIGGLGEDRVDGGSGNDFLSGDEGIDLLDAGEGDDWIFGGDGDDFIFGRNGNDMLDGGGGLDVLLAGSGDDTVYGGIGGDRAFGDAGNDLVLCGEGDDYGNGGEGDDLIVGGTGADSLLGADGDDILSVGTQSIVPTWLLRDLYDPELVLAVLEAILDQNALSQPDDCEYLSGGMGNDILLGGAGRDSLFGDHGDDWIFGFGGEDKLRGGLGEDTFVLSADTGGRTVIADFHNDIDTLFITAFFDHEQASTAELVDQYCSKFDDGVLLDFQNGTEILILGLKDPALLLDDLRLLSM